MRESRTESGSRLAVTAHVPIERAWKTSIQLVVICVILLINITLFAQYLCPSLLFSVYLCVAYSMFERLSVLSIILCVSVLPNRM